MPSDAHRDHAPAVVLARLDDVDLVAALRPVLRLPQLPGHRIPRQAWRIAMAVAPYRRQRPGLPTNGSSLGTFPSSLMRWILPVGFERSCAFPSRPARRARSRAPLPAERERDAVVRVAGLVPIRGARNRTCSSTHWVSSSILPRTMTVIDGILEPWCPPPALRPSTGRSAAALRRWRRRRVVAMPLQTTQVKDRAVFSCTAGGLRRRGLPASWCSDGWGVPVYGHDRARLVFRMIFSSPVPLVTSRRPSGRSAQGLTAFRCHARPPHRHRCSSPRSALVLIGDQGRTRLGVCPRQSLREAMSLPDLLIGELFLERNHLRLRHAIGNDPGDAFIVFRPDPLIVEEIGRAPGRRVGAVAGRAALGIERHGRIPTTTAAASRTAATRLRWPERPAPAAEVRERDPADVPETAGLTA